MKRLRWLRKPEKRSDEIDPGPYFSALRDEALQHSFPAVRGWLIRAGSRQHVNVHPNPMKVFLNTYKTRLIVSCLLMAVTVISCTAPVEYEETVGYMISGNIEGSRVTSVTQHLRTLDWVQSNEIELAVVARQGVVVEKQGIQFKEEIEVPVTGYAIRENANYQFAIPLPQTVESQANAWADDLKSIGGISDLKVAPLQVRGEDPVYKVVFHAIRDNNELVEFKPDSDQLKEAISLNLTELKMEGFAFRTTLDNEGNHELHVETPADVELTGLVTLKKFISDMHHQTFEVRSTTDLTQKYEEVKLQLDQMEAGPGRDKMEAYLKQLETKLEAVQSTGN